MVMMTPRFAVCDAFAVEAFDYLVTSPDSARLRRTLERALGAFEGEPE